MLVLLLHHVGAPPHGVSKKKLYLTAEQLRSHVRWLKAKGYRFATLTQALELDEPVACVTFDEGFQDVVDEGLPALQAEGVPATVFAVTARVGERGVVFDGDQGVAPADLADWAALARLRDQGWELGSHGHQHVRKPSAQALADSRRTLKEKLGVDATALAWPYGAYDDASVEAARAAGFRCAATTRSGTATKDQPFHLRRVILSSFGAVHAFERLKLMGVHHGVYPLRPRPL